MYASTHSTMNFSAKRNCPHKMSHAVLCMAIESTDHHMRRGGRGRTFRLSAFRTLFAARGAAIGSEALGIELRAMDI